MNESPPSLYLTIKAAFTTHRITALTLFYIAVLIWKRGFIGVAVSVFGVIAVVSLLSVVPIILLLYFFNKKWNHHKRKRGPFNRLKQLTDNQKFQLRQNTPTAQLPLVDEIFLVSLGLTFDVLNRMKSQKETMTLFEERLAQLVQLFSEMSQHHAFTHPSLSARSKNNSVMIFAFYRVLFHGVLEQAIAQNVLDKTIDQWILLKRIPPKILLHMGAQSWRAYELATLIFGDLQTLTVNSDIKALMIELCGNHPAPVSAEQNSEGGKKRDATPTQDGSPINRGKAVNAISLGQKKAATADGVSSRESGRGAEQASHEKTDKKASHTDEQGNNFKVTFNAWLEQELRMKTVNEDQHCMMDIVSHGDKTIFVTEAFLSRFCKKDSIGIDECKAQLLENALCDNEHYALEKENSLGGDLLSIRIMFKIHEIKKLNGHIVRA